MPILISEPYDYTGAFSVKATLLGEDGTYVNVEFKLNAHIRSSLYCSKLRIQEKFDSFYHHPESFHHQFLEENLSNTGTEYPVDCNIMPEKNQWVLSSDKMRKEITGSIYRNSESSEWTEVFSTLFHRFQGLKDVCSVSEIEYIT